MLRFVFLASLGLALSTASAAQAQLASPAAKANFVRQYYRKLEHQVPMHDGTKLFTVVYVPLDAASSQPYPIILERTPYSAGPYGADNYRPEGPGPSKELSEEKYIFVYQDVRGRYKSEGQFEEMTPALRAAAGSDLAHDESTDTYDTVEWLLKNIAGNNGRVGLVGISYPGFYATASLPQAHPAIRAVSPQAPVTDEFIGDDAFHKGAFYLLDNFGFMKYFDGKRLPGGEDYKEVFETKYTDAYQFFLKLGPLKNANGPQYFNGKGKTFAEYLAHPTYDAYWQARNIRTVLTNVKPAVLVVGGWYDAEDLFGALATYQTIEKQSPGTSNRLVMGPWTHGAWARRDWSKFGPVAFGENTAQHYRDSLETPFFNFYLKDKGRFNPAEATVFNTGTNKWQTYPAWPPAAAQGRTLYFNQAGSLTLATADTEKTTAAKNQLTSSAGTDFKIVRVMPGPAFTSYVSDPANPVPYTSGVHAGRNNEYMIEDQRFVASRPDVLTFQTEPLIEDLTLAGPVTADLFVATTGTDADFIVKLIDVLPAEAAGTKAKPGGVQRLVRAEPIRGRFRNSFEKPEAFVPGQVAEVKYELNDVMHTFKKGHRLMVQVQSTWFPLVDRNPQQFINIMQADAKDFQKATISVYHDAQHPSGLRLTVLPR